MQQAAVQVAGQQHPLARIGQAQQGRLQQAASAVHPKPTAPCPHQVGRGGLACGHGPGGFKGTADAGQFGQVPAGRRPAKQGRQGRGQAAAAAMGR